MKLYKFFCILALSLSLTNYLKAESENHATDSEKPKDDVVISDQSRDQLSISVDPIFKVNENDIILGNKESKVIVFEYSSYSCPHCANFHKNVFPVLKQKFIDTGKIAYVIREYIATKQDLDGALLARCGGPLMWRKFNDILFNQQDKWVYNKNYVNLLADIGKIGGISQEQFTTCLKDDKLMYSLIETTTNIRNKEASVGFIGTPCFFMTVSNKSFSKIECTDTMPEVIEQAINGQE